MLSNKNTIFMLILILFFSSPFMINTNADDNLKNNINVVFNIVYLSGTELIININANVNKITLEASDTSYNKNDIIEIGENQSEIMGAIKYALKNSLTNQIKIIFDNADIHSINQLPSFNNGIFYDEYLINLTSAFFNFDHKVNTSDFINGVLDMGAIVNYTYNLVAESGWNNTYNFILPDSIIYHRTTGIVDNNKIQWYISNSEEEINKIIAELSLKINYPISNFEKEDFQLEFELDCNYNINTNLNLSIITNSINIKKLISIPKFITNLDFIPSDGIRLFIENYFLTWDDFYNKSIKYLKENITSIIESSSFNQSLDFIFKWDINSTINCSNPFDIKNMDNNPPIKAIFSDEDIHLIFHGISSNAFFGLINSGAKSNISSSNLNFGNNFKNINYPYTLFLNLPDNIYLNKNNIISWNKTNTPLGNITSNISKKYNEEKINTTIEILVKSSDLNILSLFTGENKLTLGLFINEVQNRNVTILPEYLKIPEKIDLKYYNSDALRLCIDEEIFDNASINSFLLYQKNLFENRVKKIFNKIDMIGLSDNQEFQESIYWDKDITKMGDDYPIRISSYSNIAYSIPFRFSLFPPSINIFDQKFNFSGEKNQNIIYKIIFPKGLKIDLNNESNRTQLHKTENDQYYIEISIKKNQSNLNEMVSFSITPSIIFIISLFTPCIISLFITIILVIVIYLIRRKRKVKKVNYIKDNKNNYEPYEEQDYYIPPPPSSK